MKKHKYITFGVMLNISGNAIVKANAFKCYVTLLSKFGYTPSL